MSPPDILKMFPVLFRLNEPTPVVIPLAARTVLSVAVVLSVRFATLAYDVGTRWKRPLKENVPPVIWNEAVELVELRNCLASTTPPLITTWPDPPLVMIPPDS